MEEKHWYIIYVYYWDKPGGPESKYTKGILRATRSHVEEYIRAYNEKNKYSYLDCDVVERIEKEFSQKNI